MVTKKDLDHRVGRLILGKVEATELSHRERTALQQGIMGGVTLFKQNAREAGQLRNLIASIYQESLHFPFVAVDQEGGAVQRLDHILTPLPSAMALCAQGDTAAASALIQAAASQCWLLGINYIFAPVLDVLVSAENPVIGSRAFSSDAETVAQWGRFQAQAISRAGLLNCGKHFPGHGATKEDSHCRLARLDCDEKTLTARDLHPFQKTVSDLDSIMVGHIWLQSVDAEPTPASLSINVTTGILRDKLGFGKLVVTDDMTMGAVSAAVDIGNACVKAFLAGCDLLLVCSNIDEIEQAHRALSQAVDSGLISAERLELSLQRISSALKPVASWVAGQTACSRKETTRELASLVGQFSGESKELSQGAVTLLRGSVPDLNQGRWVVLVPDHPRYPLNLANYIKALLPADKRNNIHEIRYAQNPGSEEISSLAQATESKDCLFVTFRSAGERQILELGREIARTCNIKVHIPADSPFDVIATPDWDSCLCAYDPSDQGMRALAAVLSGTMSATGTCPVDLSLELPVHGQGRSD